MRDDWWSLELAHARGFPIDGHAPVTPTDHNTNMIDHSSPSQWPARSKTSPYFEWKAHSIVVQSMQPCGRAASAGYERGTLLPAGWASAAAPLRWCDPSPGTSPECLRHWRTSTMQQIRPKIFVCSGIYYNSISTTRLPQITEMIGIWAYLVIELPLRPGPGMWEPRYAACAANILPAACCIETWSAACLVVLRHGVIASSNSSAKSLTLITAFH